MKNTIKRSLYAVISIMPLFVVGWYVSFRLSFASLAMLGSTVFSFISGAKIKACVAIEKGDMYVCKQEDNSLYFVVTDRPIIFAMIGLPQTGKSTIAQAFAEVIGAVVIENNAIRNFLLQEDIVTPFPYINEVAFLMTRKMVKENHHNVVLDSDFANPVKRRMLEAFASHLNVEVRYIRIDCAKHVWSKRIRSEGYLFGRLYHEAIKNSWPDDIIGVSVEDCGRNLLIQCVTREYERQEFEHQFTDSCTALSVLNTGSEKVAQEAARVHAYRILAIHGADSKIREHYKNVVNRYAW